MQQRRRCCSISRLRYLCEDRHRPIRGLKIHKLVTMAVDDPSVPHLVGALSNVSAELVVEEPTVSIPGVVSDVEPNLKSIILSA